MPNNKYEITDIAHPQYPFLYRIRALKNIGGKVKAGDLGGFVESEQNLSFEPGDEAWLFDDSICCNEARVEKNSTLKDYASASGRAYITGGANLSCNAQAADRAHICGAKLSFNCRAFGGAMLAPAHKGGKAPMLGGDITVYGTVAGDVRVSGKLVVLENERLCNSSPDTLIIAGGSRSILPHESRGVLRRQPVRSETRGNIVPLAR